MSTKCKNQCSSLTVESLKQENDRLKKQVESLTYVLDNIKSLLKTRIKQAKTSLKAYKQ
jgi:hypothetical protein